MRVLLRCDARVAGGMGHAARALALAEEVLDRGGEVLLTGTIEVTLAAEACRRLGIEVLPPAASADGLADAAVRHGIDVVHIDDYAEVPGLAAAVGSAGRVLSSTEDGVWGRRAAHVVVDGSPGAERRYRRSDGSARLLLGTPYLPFRSRLLRHSGWGGPTRPPRILVSMGGTDALGLGTHVARSVRDAVPEAEVHLIASPGSRTDGDPPAGVVRHAPTDAVADLFASSTVVVSAAGTTTWELARLGVPAALVRVVDNQEENHRAAVAAGAAVGLGDPNRLRSPGALAALHRLVGDASALGAMSAAGRRLVDGRGRERVVDAWEDALASRRGVVVRLAEAGDASLLFGWRSEPAVRAVSRDTGELDFDAHLAWLGAALTDPDRVVLVAQLDGRPAGTVRFARRHDRAWEVSIVVDPGVRGGGRAREILAAAEARLTGAAGAVEVVATVAATNAPSAALFRGAGYTAHGDAASGWVELRKRVGVSPTRRSSGADRRGAGPG